MGGMLDDDIVLGYLDLITQLETFNQLVETLPNIRDAVLESDIFRSPNMELDYRSDYFGYTLDNLLIQQFPFPIIRNINSVSVGIKLYPIELKLPKESLNFEVEKADNRVPNIDEDRETKVR